MQDEIQRYQKDCRLRAIDMQIRKKQIDRRVAAQNRQEDEDRNAETMKGEGTQKVFILEFTTIGKIERFLDFESSRFRSRKNEKERQIEKGSEQQNEN